MLLATLYIAYQAAIGHITGEGEISEKIFLEKITISASLTTICFPKNLGQSSLKTTTTKQNPKLHTSSITQGCKRPQTKNAENY